jgi:hypothetical protein
MAIIITPSISAVAISVSLPPEVYATKENVNNYHSCVNKAIEAYKSSS